MLGKIWQIATSSSKTKWKLGNWKGYLRIGQNTEETHKAESKKAISSKMVKE